MWTSESALAAAVIMLLVLSSYVRARQNRRDAGIRPAMSATPEISESRFRVDFDLLDRYQGCSTELLRISLAGIALLGFFIDKVAEKNFLAAGIRHRLLILLGVAAIFFLICCGCSLAHRFLSADGVYYHIRSLRRQAQFQDRQANVDALRRNTTYHVSWLFLKAATIACGTAAAILTSALVIACANFNPS